MQLNFPEILRFIRAYKVIPQTDTVNDFFGAEIGRNQSICCELQAVSRFTFSDAVSITLLAYDRAITGYAVATAAELAAFPPESGRQVAQGQGKS